MQCAIEFDIKEIFRLKKFQKQWFWVIGSQIRNIFRWWKISCDFPDWYNVILSGPEPAELEQPGQEHGRRELALPLFPALLISWWKMRVEFGTDESISILQNMSFCIVIEPIFAPRWLKNHCFWNFFNLKISLISNSIAHCISAKRYADIKP